MNTRRGPSQPIFHPHGLWSLWELMLKKAAAEWGLVLAELASLEMYCAGAMDQKVDSEARIIDTVKARSSKVLVRARRVCIASNLSEVLPQIDRFNYLVDENWNGIAEVKSHAAHLMFRLMDDLNREHYFQVDKDDAQFYGKTELFGERVAKKFKGAAKDIELAGNCLTLQQSTACVFHLMRALEVAVRKLSSRLNITITPQTTWRQMTGAMDGKIKAMPEATERQKGKKNDWEGARANLHHVGSVWRNKTMHPAASYTRPQAREVFDATRVFMSGLCDL